MKYPRLLRLAWRESRGSRGRLLLLMASITLGVAALTGVRSFSTVLLRAVNENSKALLGADLVLKSFQRPSPEAEAFALSLPGEKAREISFLSMVSFPESGRTRLVQIRALDGGFPFYGTLVSDPPQAAAEYQRDGTALVDHSLMTQLKVSVGQHIKIGGLELRIAGAVDQIPGESPVSEMIAPRVFLPRRFAEESGLLQIGSRASYRIYYRTAADVEHLLSTERMQLDRFHYIGQTAGERSKAVGDVIRNISTFLALSSCFALLLGALGVFSSAAVFSREKLPTVAILRALGAGSTAAAGIFEIQVLTASFCAGLLGVAGGWLLEQCLPLIFRELLPVDVLPRFSLTNAAEGILVGVLVGVSSTWILLSRLRVVPAAAVLRLQSDDILPPDPVRFVRLAVCGGAAALLMILQAESLRRGLEYFCGAVAAGLVFWAAGKIVLRLSQVLARDVLPYSIRQGVLNLSRPGNQTAIVLLLSGFTVFLVTALLLGKQTILQQIAVSADASRPNIVLFDIQPDQVEAVQDFLHRHQAPVLDMVPMVTMRLKSVDGRNTAELLKDPQSRIPSWVLQREYRSSYRNTLRDSETLAAGEFVGSIGKGESPVPISLEQGIAEKLHVGLGSRLTFDVQGVAVDTVVRSLRTVDWQRIEPNFFVVFPQGVLEDAPQFRMISSRTPSEAASAELQRDAVQEFPGISLIDLSVVLRIVDQVLARLGTVLEVVAAALFVISLAVLANAVRSSALTRAREQALLKVLGATRRHLLLMNAAEFVTLAFAACVTGCLLAVVAAAVIARFWFSSPFRFSPLPLLEVSAACLFVMLAAGLLLPLRDYRRSSLQVLRSE
jgi:putative ABC transport system permease protein